MKLKKKEDFESRHKSCILTIGSKIEEYATSIYTGDTSGKFQNEFTSLNHFTKGED